MMQAAQDLRIEEKSGKTPGGAPEGQVIKLSQGVQGTLSARCVFELGVINTRRN